MDRKALKLEGTVRSESGYQWLGHRDRRKIRTNRFGLWVLGFNLTFIELTMDTQLHYLTRLRFDVSP